MQCEDTRGKKRERTPKGMSSQSWFLTGNLEIAQEEKEKEIYQSRGNKFVKAGMLREEDKLCVCGGKGLLGRV